ncbi:DUF1127 domain-containing protein [Aliishimia ponticola]|uniref:DUF1127 domain-containing protein n=1 Tax=Aliishimia ponticola TaxID=2499833 RepID=A0A4S4NID4_9RHOB|nr:DUF1127 domain-containing protein [Aliishimia ponticola]THH35860.1 DUF1127 domain-containing protein [Aliishimia ponticola]
MIGILANSFRTASRLDTPVRDNLRHMYEVRRERHALSKLDDHLLNDIGVSRADAEDEAQRAFWDAPTWFQR